MKHNQKGFAVVETLLILVIIGLLSGVGWYVYSKAETQGSVGVSSDKSDTQTSEELKNRDYTLFLDGSTDDSLINYYQMGLSVKMAEAYPGIVDPGGIIGDLPCPELREDYEIQEHYKDNVLTINIVNYEKVKNPKGLTENDPSCKKLSNSGRKEKFDIDKKWLQSEGVKTIKIKGLDRQNYQLDTDNRRLTLKRNTDVVGQIPFYPDKVAVMIAWGDDCSSDSKQTILKYVHSLNLEEADKKYSGLDTIYRRPNREVHVMLEKLEQADRNKYEKSLAGDCKVIVSYPNLKDMRQKGLFYQ